MAEKFMKPTALQTAAAVILGGIVGGILFLLFALVIGALNSTFGMAIPVHLRIDEDALSAGLLILFMGVSMAGFYWKELTTPPSEIEDSSKDTAGE